MPVRKDPLERLARREAGFAEKRSALETRDGMMRLVLRFFAGIAVAWALLLAAHWTFFASPRWLVLLHSLVFALTTGYSLAAAMFYGLMRRRMPERFGDT